MGRLLGRVFENTQKFLSTKSKNERKKIGQFFTDQSTASFMSGLFELSNSSKKISVLDPGAGTGILSAAFIEEAERHSIEEIHLTLVENNIEVLEVLKQNAQIMVADAKLKVNIEIIEKNYITMQALAFSIGHSNSFNSFDYVISNPPYKKISRNKEETVGMERVISGAPNLYFLFMALAIFNLKKNGEMVFIIPRSWTSGAYFKKFREYFFSEGVIENIHLFMSRKDVFKEEKVLQETMIIRFVKKEREPGSVNITSSVDTKFRNIKRILAPYNIVVHGENRYVFLPTDEFQIKVLRSIDSFRYILPTLGLKVKTGLTVDFRNKTLLREKPEKGAIPLLYSSNIKDGRINFSSEVNKAQYLIPNNKGLVQKNKDYLFLKRFTSKEEKKRLQVGIYLKEDLQTTHISTDNKLNFIEKQNGEALSRTAIYGLFCLFNSSLYDEYYRIMNGSTQVNATEINQIPVPSMENIEILGKKLITMDDLSTEICDVLLTEVVSKERNMPKIADAKNILKLVGMPLKQQADIVALTLLAMANLTEERKWEEAQNEWIRIHDIIQFVNRIYNRSYAENSRETFRKQGLHHFRNAALIEDNGKATNSPNYRYRLTSEFLELIRCYNSDSWEFKLTDFTNTHESLISIYESKKRIEKIPVIINGESLTFSPGRHNQLQKAIIEEFAPRFAPRSEVIYVGDTTDKAMVLDVRRLESLGFNVIIHEKMPDVVLYSPEKNWLFFIEAVTSVGPVSPKRKLEIEKMTKNVVSGNVYVTAFLDFKTYKKFSNQLAWDTEVWIEELPDHMIHLNGDRFLGPR